MYKKIERILNDKIVSSNDVHGGCIARSQLLITASGKQYFLKTRAAQPDMFPKEANSLKELSKANCIKIPKVIFADAEFLLLEFIKKGLPSSDFFEKFGIAFANMHKYSSDKFGFYQDNYIGSSIQYNVVDENRQYSCAEFYYQKRILPQYNMLKNKGLADAKISKYIIKLEDVINKLLKGSEETPSLLHGDLWSGNFMCDDAGNAVIFDPATYYGHREIDIAMTKMFGGFRYEFYSAYQEVAALPDGWQEREKIYLLYHYMNHLNLFGSSYYNQVVDILRYYC